MKIYQAVLILENIVDNLPNTQDKPYKKRAYGLLIKQLSLMKQKDTLTTSKINNMNITDHMKDKLIHIMDTDKSKIRELERKSGEKSLELQLLDVPGIGKAKAMDLIADGVKSIRDIQRTKYYNTLPINAQMYLQYQPAKQIPHQHMVLLKPLLTGFKRSEILMVGSFRRESPYSRDFDIMVVSNDDNILNDYIEYLTSVFNNIYIFSNGVDKASLYIDVPAHLLKSPRNITYKFDVFRTPLADRESMLLYATGSKNFNVNMRAHAKKMGYLLNQHGLFENGHKIPISKEADFFKVLKMPYVKPKNRDL